jgi:hypothetical protein
MGGHVASPRLVPQPNHLGLAWPSQAKSALALKLKLDNLIPTPQARNMSVNSTKPPSFIIKIGEI